MNLPSRISALKMRMLRDMPFFGYVALAVEVSFSEDVRTVRIYPNFSISMNPKWASELTDHELIYVLCHVVLHYVLEHLWRMEFRDPARWHLACDLALNALLYTSGVYVPRWALLDERFLDMSAEEIYDKLVSEDICVESSGNVFMDEWVCGVEDNEGGVQSLIDKAKSLMKEAMYFSRRHGYSPRGLEKFVEHAGRARIRWKHLLESYVQKLVPSDYAWVPPSRRTFSLGIYLPGTRRDTLEVVVALDTSGSISDQEYADFLEEITNMFSLYENLNMTVLMCDADVQFVERDARNPVTLLKKLRSRRGYGGTDFRPVFKWVEENLRGCRLLIYFTDGYGIYPETPPPYPVIWVITESPRRLPRKYHPPFGLVIFTRSKEKFL